MMRTLSGERLLLELRAREEAEEEVVVAVEARRRLLAPLRRQRRPRHGRPVPPHAPRLHLQPAVGPQEGERVRARQPRALHPHAHLQLVGRQVKGEVRGERALSTNVAPFGRCCCCCRSTSMSPSTIACRRNRRQRARQAARNLNKAKVSNFVDNCQSLRSRSFSQTHNN